MLTTSLCWPPCKSAISIIVNVCESYAAEYNNILNGNKSKLLFFKGISSVMVPSDIMVNGEKVVVLIHLGITVSTTDRDYITVAGKNTV